MPAMTTCAKCGFKGPHGFTEPGVGGMMYFYHDSPAGTCGFYLVGEQEYTSREDAWRAVRPTLVGSDDDWLKAWDARILEHNEKKAERLFAKWRSKH